MHFAYETRNKSLVDLLVKYGADASIVDFSDRIQEGPFLGHAEIVNSVSQSDDLQDLTKTDPLLQWLTRHRLQEVHSLLVENGYIELEALIQKMKSRQPFTEDDLIEMKIEKRGLRLRLLYRIVDEVSAEGGEYTERTFPELRTWLEDAKIGHVYEKLENQGFYLVEDLLYLDKRKIIKETMRGLGIKEDDIFQIGILIFKLETENTERSIEDLGKIGKGKMNCSWICCGIKNIFK